MNNWNNCWHCEHFGPPNSASGTHHVDDKGSHPCKNLYHTPKPVSQWSELEIEMARWKAIRSSAAFSARWSNDSFLARAESEKRRVEILLNCSPEIVRSCLMKVEVGEFEQAKFEAESKIKGYDWR